MKNFETQIAELVQGLDNGTTSLQELAFAWLEARKRARSSNTAFLKHWPTAISIAHAIAGITAAPSMLRVEAYAFLSFDRILFFDFTKAQELALKAREENNHPTICYLGFVHYLPEAWAASKDHSPLVLMDKYERYMASVESPEPRVLQHQCYVLARHLGLAHDSEDLLRKAERFGNILQQLQ